MAEQILKRRIMRRVYAVWILKRLTSPVFMKLLILVGILRVSLSVVSVPNVLQNSPSLLSDPVASYAFFNAAFWNTDIAVKCLAIAIVATALWLVRDIFTESPVRQLSPRGV